MSISASALILLLLCIRRMMSDKIPMRVTAALWLIPIVKLWIPFVNIHFTNVEIHMPDNVTMTQTQVETTSLLGIPNLSLTVRLPEIVEYLLLSGMIITGGIYLLRHRNFRRKFACSLPCKYDISQLKSTFGIKRAIRLRTSEFADSAFTYGIFKPVIILPKTTDFNQEGQLKNILCHELAHIRRFDVLFKTLLAICTVVHWFNPLVWVMAAFASRDIELACDETAIQRGNASPEEYAFALIRAEENRCYCPSAFFNGGKLEERIVRIMSQKPKSLTPTVFAATTIFTVALTFHITVINYTDIVNNTFCSYIEVAYVLEPYEAIELSEASEVDFALSDTVYQEAVASCCEDMIITLMNDTPLSEAISVTQSFSQVTFADET